MALAGEFSVIVDTRTKDEWDAGHIENATLLDSLQNADTAEEIATLADLSGCENCPILVYCRAGPRAAQALQKLELAGFKGPLYNGLGVVQWEEAGYELVNTLSLKPPCKDEDPDAAATCEKSAAEGTDIPPLLSDGFSNLSDDVTVTVTMPDEPPKIEMNSDLPEDTDATPTPADTEEEETTSSVSFSSSVKTTALLGMMMVAFL